MAQPHNKKLGEYPMTTRGREQGPEKRYRRLRFPAFTAAKWTATNPLLQRGELGVETDTRKIKVGDGITYWNDLEYSRAEALWGEVNGDIADQADLVEFVNSAVKGGLPDQTGNAGKFLTTDGTNTSWSLPYTLLQTTVGEEYRYAVFALGATPSKTSSIGNNLVVGQGASCPNGDGVTVVGISAKVDGYSSVAIGTNALADGTNSVAIGGYAVVRGADRAIQIGYGTNSTADTMCVGFGVNNYTLLGEGGIIPTERLAAGGTTGQMLTKTDNGATWADAPSAAITTDATLAGTGTTDSPLGIAQSVKDSIDEKVAKTGGTMTGMLEIYTEGSAGAKLVLHSKFSPTSPSEYFWSLSAGSVSVGLDIGYSNNGIPQTTSYRIAPSHIRPYSGQDLGAPSYEWDTVYAKHLNSGDTGANIDIPTVGGTITLNEVNFQTPITDTNKGATMKEIIDVQNTSIKFKGFVSTTEPSSSEFTLFDGNMWINASAMPSSFPVPATSIRVWDGAAWQTTTDSYSPAPLDAWRNKNDNEGYYWFGGVWTVMSTDLSPDYFALDPTDGKWDIKDSINLPGNPTTTTPTTGDNSTKIATTAFVQEAVSNAGTGRNVGDIFWTARTDSALNGAVEANGAQYNFADLNGGNNNVQALLTSGALPSVSVENFDAAVAADGGCDAFGYDAGATYFKVPKKVPRILVRCQKPTADNNYTWYNVYADGWVEQGGQKTNVSSAGVTITLPIEMADLSFGYSGFGYANDATTCDIYGREVATTTTINFKAAGVTADILYWQAVGYAAPSEYTKDKWNYQNVQIERPMVQLFNSATDEAVATCASVLQDVANLNAGDYVIYWDSADATDHSHAKPGVSTPVNHGWYRYYKSGWCEQGGEYVGGDMNAVINLPLSMANANYPVVVHLVENGPYSSDNGTAVINSCFTVSGAINDRSQTQFILSYPSVDSGRTYMWQVKGWAA